MADKISRNGKKVGRKPNVSESKTDSIIVKVVPSLGQKAREKSKQTGISITFVVERALRNFVEQTNEYK